MRTLSSQQREKVQAWFDEKTALIGSCPTCGHRQWVLADHMVQLLTYQPDDTFVIGGSAPIIPAVVLTCGHCGNIQFLSAKRLGLTDTPPVEGENPDD